MAATITVPVQLSRQATKLYLRPRRHSAAVGHSATTAQGKTRMTATAPSSAPSSVSPSAPAPLPTAGEVVDFWRAAGPAAWFARNEAFDTDFRERFHAAHMAAARGELQHWLEDPVGGLALLVLLDQYPRNAFRGTAHMFATDPLARACARRLLEAGFDRRIEPALRQFCYLPFEHSEDPADQELSERLAATLDAQYQRYAALHADIVRRFGRFPHRNQALARATTDEEARFLAEGGFAG